MRTSLVVLLLVVLSLVSGPAFCGESGASDQQSAAPPVTIIAPEDGCTACVGDVLQVMLVVSEDLDVSAVAVLCDSLGIGMLREPPYVLEWDSSGMQPGEHVLRAAVYLKSGEKVGAEPVVIAFTERPGSMLLPSAKPERPPAVLMEGTPVLLQTEEKLRSGHTKEGSAIRFKVARDITGPGGMVLITYGDFAHGRVTRSRRRGAFGKAGQLEFSVDSVTAVDGTTVPLRASEEMAGKDNKGVVIASALLLTVLTVFVHGKDVEVPAGTEFVAYVDHDTEIGAPLAARAPGEVRGEPLETVTITSPVDGRHATRGTKLPLVVEVQPAEKFRLARLFLDGEEMGSIEGELPPTTLPTKGLRPGEHRIEVEVTFTNGRRVRSEPVHITVVTE